LLCKGGSSANAAAFHIVLGIDLDLVPVESMVLVEARVLGGDDRVLEIGGDLAERHELAAVAIRLVVNPGLKAALDVHGGGGRVDPSGGHEGERGQRPKKRHADDEPENQGSKSEGPEGE